MKAICPICFRQMGVDYIPLGAYIVVNKTTDLDYEFVILNFPCLYCGEAIRERIDILKAGAFA